MIDKNEESLIISDCLFDFCYDRQRTGDST